MARAKAMWLAPRVASYLSDPRLCVEIVVFRNAFNANPLRLHWYSRYSQAVNLHSLVACLRCDVACSLRSEPVKALRSNARKLMDVIPMICRTTEYF